MDSLPMSDFPMADIVPIVIVVMLIVILFALINISGTLTKIYQVLSEIRSLDERNLNS